MKRCVFFVVMLAGLLSLARPVLAAETDLDRLLDLLVQKGVITQVEAAQLRADLAMKAEAEKEAQTTYNVTAKRPLTVNAYIQPRYRLDRANNDPFDVRRARVDLRSDLTERLAYRLQAEFAGSTAKVLDATLAYEFSPWAKVTAGQFKIPFSMENLTSSPKLETINRSQVVEALVDRTKDVLGSFNGRDTGVQIGGNLGRCGDRYVIEYAAGVFNGSGIDVTTTDFNEQKDFVGRVVAHPTAALSFGGSIYSGKWSPTDSSKVEVERVRNRAGVEAAFVRDPLSLKGEWIQGRDDGRAGKTHGWYMQAGYFFVPKVLQGVVKADVYDNESIRYNPKGYTGKNHVYTYGVNWTPVKWLVMQTNYEKHIEQKNQTKNDILAEQATIQF